MATSYFLGSPISEATNLVPYPLARISILALVRPQYTPAPLRRARVSALTLHIISAGGRQGAFIGSQTLSEGTERHSGRHCSLRDCFLEPKAVDPRPGNATRSAAAAPGG